MAGSLKPWERVLFLSHTNSARDEITHRLKDTARHVVARTLDSFAMEVVSPYATLWGLPDPVRRPRQSNQRPCQWFLDVRRKAAVLLKKTPALAEAVACRFPFIIADEHQDAARDQHELVMALAGAGARVRFLGDALQGIMLFASDVPGWDALVGNLPAARLNGAWRWRDNPAFADWITAARAALVAREPIDVRGAPDCVETIRHHDHAPDSQALRNYLRDAVGDGDVVVLVRNNAQALELARDTDLGLDLFEGSNLSPVETFLTSVIEAEGDPHAQLDAVIRLLGDTGSWDQEAAAPLHEALAKASESPPPVDDARATEEKSIAGAGVQANLQQPDAPGALLAFRAILQRPSEVRWTMHSRHALGVLRDLPATAANDAIFEAAYAAQRALLGAPMPRRCVSTVHKAKGRQFRHAVIADAGRGSFERTLTGRNLLYVAISRPIQRLTLVVPAEPSPLIRV